MCASPQLVPHPERQEVRVRQTDARRRAAIASANPLGAVPRGTESRQALSVEYLEHARFGRSQFVIRAEPTGMPQGVASLSMWVALAVQLRRLFTRDRRWAIRVRRWDDDPFGKVLHEEVVPNGKHARRRIEELRQEIRSGKLSIPS